MAGSLRAELAELRRRDGLTEGAIAERAGLSRSYVHELLAGSRGANPSPYVLGRLAAAFGETPAVFYCHRAAVVCERFPDAVDAIYAERVGADA